MTTDELVNVRNMVDDVQTAIDFFTTDLGFTLRGSASPAFATVNCGNIRRLLSGSAAAPRAHEGSAGEPGSWMWSPLSSLEMNEYEVPACCATPAASSPDHTAARHTGARGGIRTRTALRPERFK
jgi:hypothetical protein